MAINPDTNPVYQELVDTLFALNMSQSEHFYTLELDNIARAGCLCRDAIPVSTGKLSSLLVSVKHYHKEATRQKGGYEPDSGVSTFKKRCVEMANPHMDDDMIKQTLEAFRKMHPNISKPWEGESQ